MDINQAMLICHKVGTKVYAVPSKLGTQIEVKKSKVKKLIRYKKRLNSHELVNQAVVKTYIFFAKEILNEDLKK